MGHPRRATTIHRCPRCRINFRLCFCAAIPRINNQLELKIVMHCSESALTSNTAYFAQMVLTNSKILLRGRPQVPLPPDEFTQTQNDYLYLFPTADSQNLETFTASCRPVILVVPDGSWTKARKFHKREKFFQTMPKYHLSPGRPSSYQLRRSPEKNLLCTYEAIAKAYGILESPSIEVEMLKFFDLMVQRVMLSRQGILMPTTLNC